MVEPTARIVVPLNNAWTNMRSSPFQSPNARPTRPQGRVVRERMLRLQASTGLLTPLAATEQHIPEADQGNKRLPADDAVVVPVTALESPPGMAGTNIGVSPANDHSDPPQDAEVQKRTDTTLSDPESAQDPASADAPNPNEPSASIEPTKPPESQKTPEIVQGDNNPSMGLHTPVLEPAEEDISVPDPTELLLVADEPPALEIVSAEDQTPAMESIGDEAAPRRISFSSDAAEPKKRIRKAKKASKSRAKQEAHLQKVLSGRASPLSNISPASATVIAESGPAPEGAVEGVEIIQATPAVRSESLVTSGDDNPAETPVADDMPGAFPDDTRSKEEERSNEDDDDGSPVDSTAVEKASKDDQADVEDLGLVNTTDVKDTQEPLLEAAQQAVDLVPEEIKEADEIPMAAEISEAAEEETATAETQIVLEDVGLPEPATTGTDSEEITKEDPAQESSPTRSPGPPHDEKEVEKSSKEVPKEPESTAAESASQVPPPEANLEAQPAAETLVEKPNVPSESIPEEPTTVETAIDADAAPTPAPEDISREAAAAEESLPVGADQKKTSQRRSHRAGDHHRESDSRRTHREHGRKGEKKSTKHRSRRSTETHDRRPPFADAVPVSRDVYVSTRGLVREHRSTRDRSKDRVRTKREEEVKKSSSSKRHSRHDSGTAEVEKGKSRTERVGHAPRPSSEPNAEDVGDAKPLRRHSKEERKGGERRRKATPMVRPRLNIFRAIRESFAMSW